jgi:tripartite-type tricarboxylate transporter receptor subunit TctC
LGFARQALVTLAIIGSAQGARAQNSVADFYRGKTMSLVVGAPAGGGYDLVGRLVASRIGAHIPGRPNVVVQNLPSAGGLVMANNLYNIAAKDGTVIGVPSNAITLETRLKLLTRSGGNAAFDVAKFNWLGTAARQPQVTYAWHTAGVVTAQDLVTKPIIMAALSPGSDSYILSVVMNNVLGARMKIVTGYEGAADTSVALERGEVQAYNNNFTSLLANHPDWIADKRVHILVQFGRERLDILPDVPTAIELATKEIDRASLRLYATKYEVAYGVMTPPGVPAERVGALRAAFDATMKDPEFIAGAQRMRLPLNSLDGAAVSKLIAEIDQAPQDVVDNMRALMTPPN